MLNAIRTNIGPLVRNASVKQVADKLGASSVRIIRERHPGALPGEGRGQ